MDIIAGIISAIAIIILSRVLAKYFPARLMAATILVAIAFIYVGFSLNGNPVHLIMPEIAMTLFFYFLALTGYRYNSLLTAVGIILHGVWDIFHHKGLVVKTDIPAYWPSYCLVVDLIDGIYFIFVFKREQQRTSTLTIPQPGKA